MWFGTAVVLMWAGIGVAGEQRCFIGTYTRGGSVSEGIYTSVFDDQAGTLSTPILAATADNPSFLAVHPNGQFLYACLETADLDDTGSGGVAAYRIDPQSGKLSELNQRLTQGGAPCHCNVDATGRFLLVANYLGGNAIVFPIDEDGSLGAASCVIGHVGAGPNTNRQAGPHAHSINLSVDNRFAYVADLGIDRVMIYRFDDERGLLVPNGSGPGIVPDGGGPRHFCIHPSGKFAWSNNELTAEVTSFQRDPSSGSLRATQNITTLPADFEGRKSTAECLVHPNGRYLYVSNRGHESTASFAIDQQSGKLTSLRVTPTEGKEPRNFFIHPSGQWLLAENQNTDSIVVFSLDPDTGAIVPTESRVTVGRPVCLRMLSR